MGELCYITTCMGRLAHLQQSLPRIAGQAGVDCVVVDYSCPDGAGDWVEANFPQVRVVRVEGETVFNRSRARNLGAAAATARWLGFFDADVLIAPGFAEAVLPMLKPGRYYRADPVTDQTHGALIVQRDAFEAFGGYDETYEGWGSEDIDIIDALEFEELKADSFPGRLLSEIPHSDALRTQFQSFPDHWLQGQINSIYRGIKVDFRRLLRRQLTADEARPIYREVWRALRQAHEHDRYAPCWIKINLDEVILISSPIFQPRTKTLVGRSVTYKVRLEKPAAEPAPQAGA
jgi:glycosyltransferase involved in cell wall biosynthesis